MNLPEKNTSKGQASKKINILFFVILCLVIAGITFFAYARSQNIDIGSINILDIFRSGFSQKEDVSGKETSEFQYDTKSHPVFSLSNDTIIECTKDSVKGLGKKGDELWSIPISMSNPMLKVSDYGILVADVGGKDVSVISGRNVKWEKTLNDNIINADINDQGYVTVVHEAKGYKGAVTAYNPQGGEIFTRFINETHVLSSKVSPSGNQVVISSVDTSGISTDMNFEITDKLGKPIKKMVKKDSMLPYLTYMGNNNIIAAGDSHIVAYDKNGSEKWDLNFNDGSVYNVAVAQGKYIVAAVTGGDKSGILLNDTGIKIINSDGKQAAEYKLNSEVKNIRAYSSMTAVNTGRDVYFITTSGKLAGTYTSQNEITGVQFFSKNEVMIITKVGIDIVSI
ncbi:MAG: DUF5711 family protein [Bacillota bacterium]|nr:DUF5711 family protein [Bacillota bacterium]